MEHGRRSRARDARTQAWERYVRAKAAELRLAETRASEGLARRVLEATRLREELGAGATLRAVSTTGAVAAFGFLPMALATGAGNEVQRPLATVVVSGIAVSSLLTLFVFPGVVHVALGRQASVARAQP